MIPATVCMLIGVGVGFLYLRDVREWLSFFAFLGAMGIGVVSGLVGGILCLAVAGAGKKQESPPQESTPEDKQ